MGDTEHWLIEGIYTALCEVDGIYTVVGERNWIYRALDELDEIYSAMCEINKHIQRWVSNGMYKAMCD